MRVIAGRARRLPLKAPSGKVTRPILDRVKVDLFNILGQGFDGCDVLDLYCGAGSLGIETISREASSCTFVDATYECIETLRQNLGRTRTADRARVIHLEADKAIRKLLGEGARFDLIFVDPPFAITQGLKPGAPITELFSRASGLFKEAGRLVLRREADGEPPELLGGLKRVRWKNIGRNQIAIYVQAPVF
ncbi:MAG: RsmD family RNA methyltransferase [Planctomycetota bacterium]